MKRGLALLNRSRDQVIIENLLQAESVYEITKGLLGKDCLEEDEGLYLPDCRLIHSFFMKFSFTAVYVNSNLEIVKVVDGVKPYRISGCVAAKGVFELIGGISAKKELRLRDKLEIV